MIIAMAVFEGLYPTYEDKYGVSREEYYNRRHLIYGIKDKFVSGQDFTENYAYDGIKVFFYGKIEDRPEFFFEIKDYCKANGYNAIVTDTLCRGFNPYNRVVVSFEPIV